MTSQPFHQFSYCVQFERFLIVKVRFTCTMLTSQVGDIIGCRTNCPGSWHDLRIAEGIYEKLEHEMLDGYCIVADSAFPAGHDRIAGKILVPLGAGERLPEDAAERKYMLQLSRSILSYCQTAEWGMRELQGSFGRLWVPLEIVSGL